MKIIETQFELGISEITLEEIASLKPEWRVSDAFSRTGVEVFHREPSGNNVDIALRSYKKLSYDAREKIDCIIFITQTNNNIFPPNSAEFIARSELPENILCFDINQGCAGFVLALILTESLLISKRAQKILIVTADNYSKITHPDDRATNLIFSDGAATTVVSSEEDLALVAVYTGTKYEQESSLCVPAFSNYKSTDAKGILTMHGPSVYAFATHSVSKCVYSIFGAGTLENKIDLALFHQGSKLILDGIAKNFGLNEQKMPRLLPKVGNITSSCLPALISKNTNEFNKAEKIFLCAFGVGLTVAGCLLHRVKKK